jgi:hypothetical protein
VVVLLLLWCCFFGGFCVMDRDGGVFCTVVCTRYGDESQVKSGRVGCDGDRPIIWSGNLLPGGDDTGDAILMVFLDWKGE